MSELDDLSTASYPIEQDKSPEQAAIEHEQTQEDHSLAALIDHPGWKKLHDKMQADVKRIRSLSGIRMNEYQNQELGEVVRSEFQLAIKLEEYLSSVENAVKAIRNGQK